MSTVETSAQTFAALAEQFRDAGRAMAVLVNGDFESEPPSGRATATRVAHLVTEDRERIWDDGAPEQYDLDDDPETLILTVPPDYSPDDWQRVREETHLNRVREQNLVILSANRDKAILDAVDVEMHHSLEYIRRVKLDPFEREHYFIELAGFEVGEQR